MKGHANSLNSSSIFLFFLGQPVTWTHILTRMLSVRATFPILRIRYPTRLFQLMANDKAIWEPPLRLAAEPVLKVYNTFTRTKVRPFQPFSAPLNSFFRSSE
jgi:hypothetical protein